MLLFFFFFYWSIQSMLAQSQLGNPPIGSSSANPPPRHKVSQIHCVFFGGGACQLTNQPMIKQQREGGAQFRAIIFSRLFLR